MHFGFESRMRNLRLRHGACFLQANRLYAERGVRRSGRKKGKAAMTLRFLSRSAAVLCCILAVTDAPRAAGLYAGGDPVGVHSAMPFYPEEARRNGETGSVLVILTIETDGSVSDASIETSSGFPQLDDAAVQGARTWRYTPKTLDGKPIRWRNTARVDFTLESSGWLFGETDDEKACHNSGLTREARIKACTSVLNGLLTAERERATALVVRGTLYANLMQFDLALKDYDALVALTPGDGLAWYDRGRLRAGQKLYADAVSDFEHAAQLRPDFIAIWTGIAQMDVQLNLYDKARDALDHSIAAKPDMRLLAWRVQLDLALAKVDDALSDGNKLVTQYPNIAGVYVMRARVWEKLAALKEAEADYDRAIALAPKLADAYLGRGSLLDYTKQTKRAMADLDTAVTLAPDNAEVRYGRAVRRAEHQQWDGALADYDAAIAAAPDSGVLYNGRCMARAAANHELEKARADCEKALTLKPGDASILDSRGLVRLRQGDYAGAIADYDAALAAKPSLAVSLYGRGIAKERSGDAAGGKPDLDAAVAMDPKVLGVFAEYGIKP
jgi:TonB family protein